MTSDWRMNGLLKDAITQNLKLKREIEQAKASGLDSNQPAVLAMEKQRDETINLLAEQVASWLAGLQNEIDSMQ